MSLFKRCEHKARVRDDCQHPWWSKIVINGARYQVSLEQHFKQQVRGRGSKLLARTLEVTLKDQLKAGAVPTPGGGLPLGDKARTPFREFTRIYKTNYVDLKGLRSWENDRKYKVLAFVNEWGERAIGSIGLDDIESFIARLKQTRSRGEGGRAASTVRRFYAVLHQMFGWAESRDFIARSPLAKKNAIELEPEDNERTRRPTPEELTAILAVAEPTMRDMIEVALETGLRQGTLRRLQGAHCDFAPYQDSDGRTRYYGLLRVPGRNVKSKKMFVAPMLSPNVAAILRRRYDGLGARADAFLFGNAVGEQLGQKTVWDMWDRALVNAGLKSDTVDPDLHFHDLRAEFASQLLEQGVPLDRIRQLLGHSTLLMTQRYLRSRGLLHDDTYGVSEESMFTRIARGGATKKATALKLVAGNKA